MDPLEYVRGHHPGDRQLEQAILDAEQDRQYQDGDAPPERKASGMGRVWALLKRWLNL